MKSIQYLELYFGKPIDIPLSPIIEWNGDNIVYYIAEGVNMQWRRACFMIVNLDALDVIPDGYEYSGFTRNNRSLFVKYLNPLKSIK